MKKCSFTIRNGQIIELFCDAIRHGFEVWVAGALGGRRVLFDHHLTHDDIEKRLYYSRTGDLYWYDCAKAEIPLEKHSNAEEMERTIVRGQFIDQPSVVAHLGFGGMDAVPIDKKILKAATSLVTGRWSDGRVVLDLRVNSILLIEALTTEQHILSSGWPKDHPVRDWWNFSEWNLNLMNREKRIGQIIPVYHVDSHELHIGSDVRDCIAHVFKKEGLNLNNQ